MVVATIRSVVATICDRPRDGSLSRRVRSGSNDATQSYLRDAEWRRQETHPLADFHETQRAFSVNRMPLNGHHFLDPYQIVDSEVPRHSYDDRTRREQGTGRMCAHGTLECFEQGRVVADGHAPHPVHVCESVTLAHTPMSSPH